MAADNEAPLGALSGATVVLGVTGGIAAYKAVEVCRRLVDTGAHVVPILTRSALRFVGETTFSALASEPVRTALFDDHDPIPHTRIGRRADLVVLCPATADALARYAAGLAGDLLGATLLATEAPVLVCPAMHTEMWHHPSVQENLDTLRARGVTVLEPVAGRLAGGDVGEGRLADPADVVSAAARILAARAGDLAGRRVVVSAGGTREAIDPVRFVGNRSSGKQGYALAEAAAARGALVTLVTTVERSLPRGVRSVEVETAEELLAAMVEASGDADVVIMAAAVADFRPVVAAPTKLKRRAGIPEIVLEPTPDVLAELVRRRPGGQVVVGFAAETDDPLTEGARKLVDKGIDAICVNDVSQPNVGFAHETNALVILDRLGGRRDVPLTTKRAAADAVLDVAVALLKPSRALSALTPKTYVDVLPDVSGIDRPFVYALADDVIPAPGTVVSIRLNNRRVRGSILGASEPPEATAILPIERVVSVGPDEGLIELARFAARRWAGPLRPFLKAATPDRIVTAVPLVVRPRPAAPDADLTLDGAMATAIGGVLPSSGALVVRTGPAEPRLGLVAAAAAAVGARTLLVLVPEHRDAEILRNRLARDGARVTAWPDGWPAAAAGGGVVVGTRHAAFARVGDLGGIVVLDAHAESYVDERAPTANATVVAAERARREAVPCLLVSPTPTVMQLSAHEVVDLPGARAWPALETIDRRGSDPRSGAYDERLARAIRAALDGDARRPVVCVLNRTGRVRLLRCGACRDLARCERCGHALAEPGRPEDGSARRLVCPGCGYERPFVCGTCGSSRLRQVRAGVTRATEELAALVHHEAVEVSATAAPIPEGARLLVGTEAVLHRVPAASLVAFVDFDNELMAARLRAAEQAYVLLGRAARLVGGRGPEPYRRVVVQTNFPDDPVLVAARSGDPTGLLAEEADRRRELRLPPYAALALLSGDGVTDFVAALGDGVEAAPRPDGSYLVAPASHAPLLASIAAAEATGARCRVAVDPDDV